MIAGGDREGSGGRVSGAGRELPSFEMFPVTPISDGMASGAMPPRGVFPGDVYFGNEGIRALDEHWAKFRASAERGMQRLGAQRAEEQQVLTAQVPAAGAAAARDEPPHPSFPVTDSYVPTSDEVSILKRVLEMYQVPPEVRPQPLIHQLLVTLHDQYDIVDGMVQGLSNLTGTREMVDVSVNLLPNPVGLLSVERQQLWGAMHFVGQNLVVSNVRDVPPAVLRAAMHALPFQVAAARPAPPLITTPVPPAIVVSRPAPPSYYPTCKVTF